MELAWRPEDTEPVVALLGYAALYGAQDLVGQTAAFERWAARAIPRFPAQASAVLARQVLGGVVLGLGAAALMVALPAPVSAYGLRAPTPTDLAWIAAAALPILGITWGTAALGPEDPVRPEIRQPHWGRDLLLANAAAWVVYLAGYELALRGLLLLGVAHALGPTTAVAVNLAIYTLIHLPKGARETVAAGAFGVLACAAVLHAGSVWPPFALHLLAAVTNDTVRARRFSP